MLILNFSYIRPASGGTGCLEFLCTINGGERIPSLQQNISATSLMGGKACTLWETRHSIFILFYFCLFAISGGAPVANGGSQARGQVGAIAAGLHQSHSKARSELRLRPTPQLTAMPDP